MAQTIASRLHSLAGQGTTVGLWINGIDGWFDGVVMEFDGTWITFQAGGSPRNPASNTDQSIMATTHPYYVNIHNVAVIDIP